MRFISNHPDQIAYLKTPESAADVPPHNLSGLEMAIVGFVRASSVTITEDIGEEKEPITEPMSVGNEKLKQMVFGYIQANDPQLITRSIGAIRREFSDSSYYSPLPARLRNIFPNAMRQLQRLESSRPDEIQYGEFEHGELSELVKFRCARTPFRALYGKTIRHIIGMGLLIRNGKRPNDYLSINTGVNRVYCPNSYSKHAQIKSSHPDTIAYLKTPESAADVPPHRLNSLEKAIVGFVIKSSVTITGGKSEGEKPMSAKYSDLKELIFDYLQVNYPRCIADSIRRIRGVFGHGPYDSPLPAKLRDIFTKAMTQLDELEEMKTQEVEYARFNSPELETMIHFKHLKTPFQFISHKRINKLMSMGVLIKYGRGPNSYVSLNPEVKPVYPPVI